MRDQVQELEREKKSQKVKIYSLSFQLGKVRKNLRVFQSKKTRSKATKRNLLLYHTLNKYKHQEIQMKSDASSFISDQSSIEENLRLPINVKKKKRTIRNQLDEIQYLQSQTNQFEIRKKDNYQNLKKDIDILDRYKKRITKKNEKVKETW